MVIEASYNGRHIAIAGTRIQHLVSHLTEQVDGIITRDLKGDFHDKEADDLETWGVLEFLTRRGIIITIR